MPDHSPNLLLLDDHRDTLEMWAKLLRREGYGVVTADCIADARVLAKQGPYDLLVADIRLRDGDCYDLVRELVRDHTMPAIALSGLAYESDRLRSREAGFLRHLAKPVEVDELLLTIREVLAAKQPSASHLTRP